MRIACPFCGVPIQYPKPALPTDFTCPGCSKPFTSETINRKQRETEELLKGKLHELYTGSQRPCSSEQTVFQAILLSALAAGRGDFRDSWETAGYPTMLPELENILSSIIDYNPDECVIFEFGNRAKRRSTARLIHLLSEFYSDAFEGHVADLLQGSIINLIANQLREEQDMKVVELLCYVLNHWSQHRNVREAAFDVLLSVVNNHEEAIFTTFGSSYLTFLYETIPEAREQFFMVDCKYESKHEAVEAIKAMITVKSKSA